MALRRLRPPPSGNVLLKDTPADYTAADAPDRVLIIDLWFLRYGTNDRFQGAAIFLGLLLIILISVVIIIGLFSSNSEWLDRVFTWLGSAFLFVAGVAVGRASSNSSSPRD
jgi:hypothetical protein